MINPNRCFLAASKWTKDVYPTVVAEKFIRKLPGSSQSILVRCNDGNYYVVKMRDNPQGGNTLANELLGHQIISAMGLPVADYAFVRLSHAFITAIYPGGWYQMGRTSTLSRPEAGVHLGCQFVGWPDGESRTSDYISPSQIGTVQNRADFTAMLIIDAWAGHQDSRQAVFYSHTRSGPLNAVFIDHGMMFGGRNCIFKDDKCRAFYFSLKMYDGVWNEQNVERWKSRLREAMPLVLQNSFRCIPSSWYDFHHKQVREALLERLDNLDHLIEPYASCFN